LKLDYNLWWI